MFIDYIDKTGVPPNQELLRKYYSGMYRIIKDNNIKILILKEIKRKDYEKR